MTRVSEAAATTLQAWTRKSLAQKEAANRRYQKLVEESAPFLEKSVPSMIKHWGKQLLVVGAAAAVLGLMASEPSSASSQGASMMASSPIPAESGKSFLGGFAKAILNSSPSSWAK